MTTLPAGRRGARLALVVFLLAYAAVVAIIIVPDAFGPAGLSVPADTLAVR
ncbi:MAG: hypothetical protein H5U20_07245 [Rhodobacteraceae bacterium]|nr:hypothetical protein [Paracoccaceae bacterium]